jgi:hypothetical protein
MPRKSYPTKHKRINYSLISCGSKRKYKNQNEAENIAEIQMLINQNIELGVYKCEYCNYWHLTNTTK